MSARVELGTRYYSKIHSLLEDGELEHGLFSSPNIKFVHRVMMDHLRDGIEGPTVHTENVFTIFARNTKVDCHAIVPKKTTRDGIYE